MLASLSAVNTFPSDLARGTRRRCRRIHVSLMFLAAVGVSLASPTAPRAASASTPDSAHIVLVRSALLNFNDVRVVAKSRDILGHHGVVSANGLYLRPSDPSLSSPRVRLVPWAEIDSIRARRGSSGVGPVLGGTLGLVVGTLLALREGDILDQRKDAQRSATILTGLVGGGTLGWLIDRPGPWKTVYP